MNSGGARRSQIGEQGTGLFQKLFLRRRRVVGKSERGVRRLLVEGHRAAALEENAEGVAGEAIGDEVVEQGLEDAQDLAGNVEGGEIVEFAAELAPAGEAVPEIFVGAGAGLRGCSVMAAEGVAAGGGAAALAAVGQGEDAFGGHEFS